MPDGAMIPILALLVIAIIVALVRTRARIRRPAEGASTHRRQASFLTLAQLGLPPRWSEADLAAARVRVLGAQGIAQATPAGIERLLLDD